MKACHFVHCKVWFHVFLIPFITFSVSGPYFLLLFPADKLGSNGLHLALKLTTQCFYFYLDEYVLKYYYSSVSCSTFVEGTSYKIFKATDGIVKPSC